MKNNDTVSQWKRETEHIIAFFDLLGAKEIISSAESETALNIISETFRRAGEYWPHFEKIPEVLHGIKHATFSDNIALALDLSSVPDRNNAIINFIKYIYLFQRLTLKSTYLFRGGIAIGPLYMDSNSNVVWGKALTDAYTLEGKTAIYPRVVLSRQFEKIGWENIPNIRKDFDGIYFVDYISPIDKVNSNWIEKMKEKINSEFSKRMGKTDQVGVLQKYDWLQRYIEHCEKLCERC